MGKYDLFFKVVKCEYVSEPILLCNENTLKKLENQCIPNPVGLSFSIQLGGDDYE